MYRGTTPQHTFTLPDELAEIEVSALYITYSQLGRTRFEKTLDDVTRDGVTLTVTLTQDDTLALKANLRVDIQIRLLTDEGNALASEIIYVPATRILKDGEIPS